MENRPSHWFAALALLTSGGSALAIAANPTSSPPTSATAFSIARIALGGAPKQIEVGDLDGDGDADLVVLSSSIEAATLTVLRNNGDDAVSVFSSSPWLETTFTVSWVAELAPPHIDEPPDLELADLDGDGDLDLLQNVPFGGFAGFASRLNAGDGTFDAVAAMPLLSQRVDVELAHLNGDSTLDLSFYDLDLVGYVGTREGNGDGTFEGFGPEISGAAYDSKANTALGELTGDALLDMVIATSVRLQLTRGVADVGIQGWQFPVETLATGVFGDVVLADLDGNGRTDVVATRPTLNLVAVLFGQPGGGLGSPHSFPAGPRPDSVTVASLGIDSVPDVVTTNRKRGLVTVLHGAGEGALLPPESFYVTPFPSDVAAADLDGDGDTDLAVTDYREGTVSLLFNLVVP